MSTIHRLFEAQVRSTPDAPALIYPSSTTEILTYRELNQWANRLANYLQTLGAGPETLVAVCMEPSPERVIALLAVLKTGGAYIPLDPTYPAERLAFMLADSRAPFLLTQPHLREHLPSHQARVLAVELNDPGLTAHPAKNLPIEITPDYPAYIIYTSGSTGTPKGVIGLHQGAVNRFRWMWAAYPFEPGEICCQKTALSFVDSIWEIFGPLLQGVPGLVVPGGAARDPERLVQLLAEHRVSRLVLVPSLLRLILGMPVEGLSGLSALKIWVSSGETLPVEWAHEFHRKLPGRTLLNLYGSSEVSADATWAEIRPDKNYDSVPIGRPIANIQAYILNVKAQLLPSGAAGELHLGGDGLARGYLNRPDLTAERFIPDPVSGRPGARLYKTGDLARWLPDGTLEFLGRVDHQVKIRGFRVELGEVEAALAQHPGVRETVVMALPYKANQNRLVAYLVPQASATPTRPELHQFLAEKLPDYMIPTAFMFLRELPLTPNGKIDRQTLPQPDQPASVTPFVAPRSAMEKSVAELWAELLGLEQVGVYDQFLELGGHSLLATQLISRLRQTFQVEIPVGGLLEAGTVAAMAEQLELAFWLKTARSHGPSLQPGGSREGEGERDEGEL